MLPRGGTNDRWNSCLRDLIPKNRSTAWANPYPIEISPAGRGSEFKTERMGHPRQLMNTNVSALLPSTGLLLNSWPACRTRRESTCSVVP